MHPHPAQHLVEQHRHEEHALGVIEVGNGQDGHSWPSLRREQQAIHVERLTLEPGGEARGCEQLVELHGQREAIALRVEGVEVEHADAGHGGPLNLLDEGGQVEVGARLPRLGEDGRDEHVLATAHRVRRHPRQGEEARRRRLDPLRQQLRIVAHRRGWCGERPQDREAEPRAAPGRVDRKVRRRAQARDAVTGLAPGGQPLRPPLRFGGGERLRRHLLSARVVRVDPREEVVGRERREGEHEIGYVALRVDGDDRHAIERRLLEQREAQTGLAAARHPHAHGVRDEVARIVQHKTVTRPAGGQVVRPSEVEEAELLVVLHGDSSSADDCTLGRPGAGD